MPAALLGRVLAVAGVVVLVLSPAATVATVATAGRDAIGQEREPCAVDRADGLPISLSRCIGREKLVAGGYRARRLARFGVADQGGTADPEI